MLVLYVCVMSCNSDIAVLSCRDVSAGAFGTSDGHCRQKVPKSPPKDQPPCTSDAVACRDLNLPSVVDYQL